MCASPCRSLRVPPGEPVLALRDFFVGLRTGPLSRMCVLCVRSVVHVLCLLVAVDMARVVD